MHPLTPVIRSWRVVVPVLALTAQSWGDDLLRGDPTLPDLSDPAGPGVGRLVLGGGAILAAVVVVGVGLAVLSWRATRFRVEGEALELLSGILFRQHRRARLDRVQTVDVVQPFVARLVGLARLTLEVAGGSGSNIALSYLSEDDALALRNHLLAEAAGIHYDSGPAPEAPEREVLQVPVGRLIGGLALSGPTILFVLGAGGCLAAAVAVGNPGPVAAVFPAGLGVAGVLWNRFSGGFGFRVAVSPDGLRLRHGLLEQRSQTVPPGRVQAVRIRQGALWQLADWWQVEVNIAGYSGGGSGDFSGASTGSTLLPVGSRQDAVYVLSLVLPDLGVGGPQDAWDVVAAGLQGTGTGNGWLPAPRRARWVDPIGWRRCGARVTDRALLTRRGVLNRTLDIVPHARTQSLGVSQGPLQRRLRLASFALHSTAGPVRPVAQHLDAAAASQLLLDQAVRAREARGAAGPERWMQRVPQGQDLRGQESEPDR